VVAAGFNMGELCSMPGKDLTKGIIGLKGPKGNDTYFLVTARISPKK